MTPALFNGLMATFCLMAGTAVGVVMMCIVSINKDAGGDHELKKDGQRLRALIDTHHALMPEGGQWWVEGPTGEGIVAVDPREAIDQACIKFMLHVTRVTPAQELT
jgi:hypothetical protein